MKTAPLEPSHALLALEDADDREQILDVLLRAVRSRATFAALLSVHGDGVRGRRALADTDVEQSHVDGWRFPRGTVHAFEQAIATRAPSLGPLASSDLFVDGLLAQLGGGSPAVLVLPIAIGARTVALVVAHRERDPLALADVSELLPLAEAASPALARVLATRSKATATAPRSAPEPGYEVEVTIAGIDQLRARVEQARAREQWHPLADAIRELVGEGVANGDPDEDEQLALLIELGRIEAEQLGRIEPAIDAWKSAQTIDAGDPRLLDALQALYVQHGRWADCADVIEKRVALAEQPAERVTQLLELAAIAHERLDDDERAIAAYERVLHWEPAHAMATRELEHLYSGRQQWEPLAALLLDRASREADTSALEHVAQLYEDKLGNAHAALLVWLALFRREPERDDLVDQLARLAPAAQAWDELLAEGAALAEELEGDHPAVAARVWRLVGLWTREHTRNGEDAAHALATAARLETDRRIRAELFTSLGEVYETLLSRVPEAIACYEKARVDEPESPVAHHELHRLYRETLAWKQLAELLPERVRALDADADRELVADLRVELAGVLADHLGRTDEAIAEYQAVLAVEPKHPAAFHGLAAVYHATGQTEALLDASEREVDGGDPTVQLRRYPELARAWHERARFDRAIACWEKLVALDASNAAAHRGLADALHANAQWGSLATSLRALLELASSPEQKLALLLELGGVLAAQLDDVDGALAAYQAALGIDPDHLAALDALAALYERAGQPASAIAVLERLLAHTPTPKPRAQLFERIGHGKLEQRDLPGARLAFENALVLDIERAGAHEGLARVHLQQDEVVAGGEKLVRAAELAADGADKQRCLLDAAWVFRHRLKDHERARQCLQLVLDLEPEHADAKAMLAELLQDANEWEMLWPHLEQELKRANDDASLAAEARRDIYTRAARCALELDHFGTALELYDLAVAGKDAPPQLHVERAEAMYRSKSLDAAAGAFQAIVLRFAQALDRDRLIAVYRRLGEIHTALGKLSQAQLFLQKVLELEPKHRASLKDLAELHAARGRFDEAIASLRALAEQAQPAERVALLERVGDLYRDRLHNAPRAMSTYVEALELDGANHRILQRLLDLQSAAGQWKAAVDTIDRFLACEQEPARRAAYYLAAAEVRRNELKDRAGALDDYEHALDELFREQPLSAAARARGLDTFRLVDELLTADKDWRTQERAYRKMIKRVPDGDPTLVLLWDALGEVYRSRLKHYESAIESFEIAHALDPDKAASRASILGELYALTGKRQPSQVLQRAAKLVEKDPVHQDTYRTLGRASAAAGRIDEAWCAARALVFLKQASADETALYNQLRAHETRKPTGFFDEQSWGFVRHPDEDKTISAIFALTWDGAIALRAGPAKAFELKAKDRVPVEDGTRVIAKIFRHAARVLAVGLPEVYVQPHRAGRLLLANIVDRGRLSPAVIVGRDLMAGYRDTEIAAAVGALLALLRPAYYLELALPEIDELEAALAAAAQVSGRPGLGRPELEPLRTAFAAEIEKRLPRSAIEPLRGLVARLPDRPDLTRWRHAVDAAAARAALLLCGELAAAGRMLATDSASPGRPRGQQRVHELVAYSVSPEYFAARKHLGVAIS